MALVSSHLLATPRISAAETNASIPYKNLDDLCHGAATIDQARLAVSVFISSKNAAVHPADITLTIHSAVRGKIPVQIGTNGQILNFPHQEDLRRENPPILANLPKGTLSLSLDVHVPIPDALTFRYSRLGDAATEAGKAIKAQAGMLSWLVPKINAMDFTFPKSSAGKAKVEILSASGKKIFTADKDGEIKLKLEKPLLKENPEVKMSEKPESISPDVE